MADLDKGTNGHVENAGKPRTTFGTHVRNHFRRFWWLHVIFFICSTLLITLCIIYVGFPNIAQHDVNRSQLNITSMTLSDPTENSFVLTQDTALHNPSMYTPTLDAFNASLFMEDTEPNIKPFAYVQVPNTHALHDTVISIVNQTVQIADLEQQTRFSIAIMNSETLRFAMRGRPRLHLGRLPVISVNYNKVFTMKGLNKLNGFNITSFQILLTPDKTDGANLIGTAYIPNPSPLTLYLGNLTYNLYTNNTFIGTSTLNNLILHPGNNTVPIRSTTNQTTVLQNLPKDGMLPLDIVGNTSMYNGVNLTYYSAAIQSNTQHISLNISGALGGLGLKA